MVCSVVPCFRVPYSLVINAYRDFKTQTQVQALCGGLRCHEVSSLAASGMRARYFRSLRTFILVHEGVLLLLIMVTGFIGGMSAYFWQRSSSESARLNAMLALAEQVRGDLYAQVQGALRARVLPEEEGNWAWEEAHAGHSRRIDDSFNMLRRHAESQAEAQAVQTLQVSYRQIQYDMDKFSRAPRPGKLLAHIRISDHDVALRMLGGFEQKYTLFKSELRARQEQLDHTLVVWAEVAPIVIPILIVIAILVILYTRLSFNRGFVKPIAAVIRGAQRMSRGHLEEPVPEQGVAEVSELADTLNRMARDLKHSRDALVESERQAALGELVPVVAHNIRNPLASIRATAQMIDADDSPEELQETCQRIIAATDRLGRWVNALVSYLHPLKLHLGNVLASQLLLPPLALLENRLKEKRIQLVRTGWENDRLLEVDPDLMEQAIYGLMANALDAAPDGSVLELKMSSREEYLLLHIIDSGPGMPYKPKSGRLEPGLSTKRFGTGLGIPVALKICQKHGWSIQFDNVEQGGTEVVIAAPLSSISKARP